MKIDPEKLLKAKPIRKMTIQELKMLRIWAKNEIEEYEIFLKTVEIELKNENDE